MDFKGILGLIAHPLVLGAAGGYGAYRYLGKKEEDPSQRYMYAAGGAVAGAIVGYLIRTKLAPQQQPQQQLAPPQATAGLDEYVDLDRPIIKPPALPAHQPAQAARPNPPPPPPSSDVRSVESDDSTLLNSMGSFGEDGELGSYNSDDADEIDVKEALRDHGWTDRN